MNGQAKRLTLPIKMSFGSQRNKIKSQTNKIKSQKNKIKNQKNKIKSQKNMMSQKKKIQSKTKRRLLKLKTLSLDQISKKNITTVTMIWMIVSKMTRCRAMTVILKTPSQQTCKMTERVSMINITMRIWMRTKI